jgi:chromosome segregation ATPase
MQLEMEDTVRQELETFYRMSGVFIQMLMFEAEQQNSTLRADCNYMENYRALEEIKDFEKLAASGDQSFSLQKKKGATSKLPTLGSAMLMTQNESAEAAQLKEENIQVKRMMQAMQEKLAGALLGKSMLTEKVEGETKETSGKLEELSRKLERAQEERDKAMEVSENLRKEAQNTKQELQKKVNQLTQVTNMKKMIQDKNGKIAELRERLGKYEADIGGDDDDDK